MSKKEVATLAKPTKKSLAKSIRKAKIDKNLENKDAIQEEVGIIASIEVMPIEEHKKKLAKDATLKALAERSWKKFQNMLFWNL